MEIQNPIIGQLRMLPCMFLEGLWLICAINPDEQGSIHNSIKEMELDDF